MTSAGFDLIPMLQEHILLCHSYILILFNFLKMTHQIRKIFYYQNSYGYAQKLLFVSCYDDATLVAKRCELSVRNIDGIKNLQFSFSLEQSNCLAKIDK